jgi:hypothetical protein
MIFLSTFFRFADDLDVAVNHGSRANPNRNSHEFQDRFKLRNGGISNGGISSNSNRSSDYSEVDAWIRSPRKSADHSVEKYFDNLISMIEDAAEGL